MENALIKIFKFICYCLCLTSLQINLWSLLILIGEIFFVFFWHATHRMFIPRPRIKPISPSVKVWSPNHRTTREIPEGCYFYGPNRCFFRESPRETFFNTSRGQIPLPWLGSNDALPLATRMETRLPWRPTRGSLTSPSYLVRNRTLGPPLENNPEIPCI